MSDLKQAAERVAEVRSSGKWWDRFECYEHYCFDCELLASAYLDQRAEILAACLEESTYDGLYRRMMELHERGE